MWINSKKRVKYCNIYYLKIHSENSILRIIHVDNVDNFVDNFYKNSEITD